MELHVCCQGSPLVDRIVTLVKPDVVWRKRMLHHSTISRSLAGKVWPATFEHALLDASLHVPDGRSQRSTLGVRRRRETETLRRANCPCKIGVGFDTSEAGSGSCVAWPGKAEPFAHHDHDPEEFEDLWTGHRVVSTQDELDEVVDRGSNVWDRLRQDHEVRGKSLQQIVREVEHTHNCSVSARLVRQNVVQRKGARARGLQHKHVDESTNPGPFGAVAPAHAQTPFEPCESPDVAILARHESEGEDGADASTHVEFSPPIPPGGGGVEGGVEDGEFFDVTDLQAREVQWCVANDLPRLGKPLSTEHPGAFDRRFRGRDDGGLELEAVHWCVFVSVAGACARTRLALALGAPAKLTDRVRSSCPRRRARSCDVDLRSVQGAAQSVDATFKLDRHVVLGAGSPATVCE